MKQDSASSYGPMTWTVLSVLALAAVIMPLLPNSVRPWNFALFGALGLFAGARTGFWPALAVSLGSKIVSDMANYYANHQHPEYLPMPEIIACFAIYPVLGQLLRSRTHFVAIGSVALIASLAFFFASNAFSWYELKQKGWYANSFAGLLDCYAKGIPFYRGTLVGDSLLSIGVFAVHSLLATRWFPVDQTRGAMIPNEIYGERR